MRVLINARIPSGSVGGVAQVIIGLASGLAEIAQPGEDYVFLTNRGEDDWLRPYVGGACRIAHGRTGPATPIRTLLKRVPGVVPLRRAWRRTQRAAAIPLPADDGTMERLQADVVHFPHPEGFATSIPSIYHPWDLQHVHFPAFFTPAQLATRDLWYRALCSQAAIVSVATDWGKEDLAANLQVSPGKIEVIPMAPVLTAYAEPSAAEVREVRTRLDLPETFAYYPAHTWPHKNHLALVEALAVLRGRGVVRHVVFSGRKTPHAAVIQEAAVRLGVQEQVRFLGFVTPLEVQCLYRLATCLVFPSRFEGWGLPVTEAFLSGLPVASSDASCLPETAGGAALLFDPDDVEAVAGAMERLLTDEALRGELIGRGRAVVGKLSWARTAAQFRQLYHRLAGVTS